MRNPLSACSWILAAMIGMVAPLNGAAQSPADNGLAAPVRLEADGKPIDIGTLSDYAHAGPWVADVDGDGNRDLLVGDFPGYFWFFRNEGTDRQPRYAAVGQLQAGGQAAKTPVY